MKFRQAQKTEVKLKIAITSPAGFGKTLSSLFMAYGITGDWSKVGLIDTEHKRADLYADIGPFQKLDLDPPYSPERYIIAINEALSAGIECLIIDSMSHEWDGSGGVLEIKDKLGAGFSEWGKVLPRHKAFIDTIMQTPIHIIGTMRKKTDYVVELNDQGKHVPRKVGLKDIQRDGIDYEFSLYMEIQNKEHVTIVSKDTTGVFNNDEGFVITEETGKRLIEWAKTGTSRLEIAKEFIPGADIELLKKIHLEYPDLHKYPEFMLALSGRRLEINEEFQATEKAKANQKKID